MSTTPERAALRNYLNDHLAGAAFGLALARRIAAANPGSDIGGDLTTFAQELVEDRADVADLLQRLGFARDLLRQAGAVVAEQVTRLRLDRRVTGSGALSRLLELEILVAGVTTKRALWGSLEELTATTPEITALPLDDLVSRADRQLAMLEGHRRAAVRRAMR